VPHIPALNGLRAVACLAVFGVHWQQFTGFSASWGPFDAKRFLEHGNTGVSLLFTLSAFLISLRFWAGSWGHGHPWLHQYARSRALRILPPYYLCLVTLVAFSGHVVTTGDRTNILLHITFLHNLREATFYAFNPAFWTLAVQIQAYVLMPIVVLLIMRASSSWNGRALLLVAATAASYATHWAILTLSPRHGAIAEWAASQPTVATHTLLAHAPHFLLGLLAGLIYVKRISNAATSAERPSTFREVAVCATVGVILLILSTPLDEWFAVPYGRYNFPFVPLMIAWLILEIPRTHLARSVLDVAALHRLGVISFGVYVYHHPCLRVTGSVMERAGFSIVEHWAVFGAASLALAIVVASASFVAIEAPLLQLARRREQRQHAAVLSAS